MKSEAYEVVIGTKQSQGPYEGLDGKHSRRQQIAANEIVRGEEDFREPADHRVSRLNTSERMMLS